MSNNPEDDAGGTDDGNRSDDAEDDFRFDDDSGFDEDPGFGDSDGGSGDPGESPGESGDSSVDASDVLGSPDVGDVSDEVADAPLDEVADEFERPDLVVDVEAPGRFVEQECGRLLGERAGEDDSLALATAERPDRSVPELCGLGALQGALDHGGGRRIRGEATVVRSAPHLDDVRDRELEGERRVLRDGRDPAAGRPRGECVNVLAGDADRAGVGRDDPVDGLQERGLAGAVRADEADELAGRDRQRDALQDRRVAVGGDHVSNVDERVVGPGGRCAVGSGHVGVRRARCVRDSRWIRRGRPVLDRRVGVAGGS